MKAICFPKKEEVANRLKSKKALYPKQENADQQTIVSKLDFVHDVIATEKTEDGRYQTFDKGHVVKKRVTDMIKNTFAVGKTIEELKRWEEENKKYSETGTFIHNVLELIGKSMNEGTYKADRKQIFDYALIGNGVQKMDGNMFLSLEKGMKEMLDDIESIQNSINPNEKAVLRFEHKILDPYKDMAGTIDLLVVYSDGSADILDIKTKKEKGYPSLFGYRDFSNYEIQLSNYKKILLEHYDVRKIRRGRVVPIAVTYASRKDKKTGQWVNTNEIKNIEMGREMGKRLEQRMVLPEITDVDSIDTFIKGLYEKLEKKNDPELRELLNSLVISQDLKPVVDYFIHVSTEILAEYHAKGRFGKEESEALEEVRIGAMFLESLTKELRKLEKFPEIKDKAVEYAAKINQLRETFEDLNQIRSEALLDKIYTAANRKAPDNPNDIVLKEDSFWTKWLGRISDFNNPFFKYLRNVLDKIQFETRRGLREDEDLISTAHVDVQRWMKEKGKTWDDVVELIFNKETENLYAELDSRFYEEREGAVKNGNYAWIVKHYQKSAEYDAWYQATLARKITEAENRFEGQAKKDFVDKWKDLHDLSLNKNGSPVSPKAWVNWKHLEIKESTKEEYRSEKFKAIMAEEPIHNYYKTIISMNRKFREMLGLRYGKMPDNFLPFVRKDLIEKYQTMGMSGAWEDIRQVFAIREDETEFGHINDLTGKFDSSIPMYFTNPFRNDDGSIKKGEKTTDFTRSMLLFSKMAHNYKWASHYEAHIHGVRDMLSNAKYIKTDTLGRKIFDKFGDLKTKVNPEMESVFNTFVDYYFYGKTLQQEGTTFKVLGQDVNSVQLIRKAKQYFSLKSLGLAVVPATASFVSAGTQAWMEGKEGIAYTSEQWKSAFKRAATDRTKYLSLFKFFEVSNDDLMNTVSIDKNGSVFGDNLYQDKFRKFVSSRMLMAPYRLGDEVIDMHIANAMAENFVVNKAGVLRRKAMVDMNSGEWKTVLEVFNVDEDGKVNISHVNPENVKNLMIKFKKAVREAQRGIKGTMTDEDIMLASTHLFTNLLTQFRTWMPGVLNKRFGSFRYNENLDALKYGKYMAFGPEFTPENFEATNAIVHYFTKGVLPTMKEVTKDLLLGTISFGAIDALKYNVERRYKNNATYKKAIDAWFNKWKMQNSDEYDRMIEVYGSEEALMKDFLNIKQRAIRNTMNEIRTVLLIFGLIMFLKSDMDDDDEPLWQEYWLTHKSFQIANRTMTELMFAFDPTSLQAILKGSAIPMTGLLVDATNVIKEAFEPLSDAITGREEKKNEKEFSDRFAKLFPAITQLIKTFDLTDEEESTAK